MNTLVKIFTFIFVFVIAIILYSALTIVTYASQSSLVNSDAAIILGAGIVHDKPSPVFRERIAHGITLYKTGKVQYLVFTGGLGKGEIYTESEVARMYAIKQGVSPSDIFLEGNSKITYENILEAEKVLRKNKINSVLIVSDPLHMKRSMTMARDLGVNANTAPTPTSMYKSWSTKTVFLAKEIYFYIGYLLHSRLVKVIYS